MATNLQEIFFDGLEIERNPEGLALWAEISSAYRGEGRFYHDLSHLSFMLDRFQEMRTLFEDEQAVLAAIFYHDIVYDAQKRDNEERSADLAVERLQQLGWAESRIERCRAHILATRSHEISADPDSNLLVDIDLGVLAEPWEVYAAYAANIRKEYAVYPDNLYIPGRIQVLRHFLGMEQIYKSSAFRDEKEPQARINLQKELDALLVKAA